jgi:hypothetical protein
MKGQRSIPARELDTNIKILHALLRPGERLSSRAIAESVGCTNTLIYLIEKKALRKVREHLRQNWQMDHGEFAQAKVSEHL